VKFSKEYSKLSLDEFTTIRKRSRMYWPGSIVKVSTPKQIFNAEVISRTRINKCFISDELAQSDADCTREELIKKLTLWYGTGFDDFILLRLRRIIEIGGESR
jgi:hypothetical protein